MSLILGIPRRRQPQGVVGVNWDNPLALGLAVAINPAAGLVNLAAQVPLGYTALPDQTAGAPGRLYMWDRASPAPFDTGIKTSSVGQHSAIVVARHRSLSGLNAEYFFSNRDGSNRGWGFYTVNAAGSVPNQIYQLGYVHNAVAAYASGATITGGNTDFNTVGFSATVSSNIRFFAKGAFLSQVSVGAMTTSTEPLIVAKPGNSASLYAHYEAPVMLYWRRRLSDEEHARIAANPWQLFAPRRIIVPVAAAGATVPSLSSPTTTNITATTARLGLTLTF